MSQTHHSFDEKSLPPKALVVFFCGTGANFHPKSKSHIDQKQLGYQETELPDENTLIIDTSMLHLDSMICALDPEKARAMGYDGCHRRGGGTNATGIEQPANHLYQHLKKLNTKTNLIITAHSRGCMSAYLAAKLINADKELQKNVTIVLDLRDPVPGNLKGFSTLFGSFTTSGAFYDLTECTNIKSVDITIQETGILPVAFNVLIPRFSANTRISLSALPGMHDIQERMSKYLYDKTNGYVSHIGIYQLGLYKSLQLYLENHIPISSGTIKNEITAFSEVILKSIKKNLEENRAKIDVIGFVRMQALQTQIVESLEKSNDALVVLKNAQLLIYENILNDYKEHPDRKVALRNITFGGQSERSQFPLEEVKYLNAEHYRLAVELAPLQVHKYILMYVLEGQKPHLAIKPVEVKPVPLAKPAEVISLELKEPHCNDSIIKQLFVRLKDQVKLFKDEEGRDIPVYQPLLEKIQKNIAVIEKNLVTQITKISDQKVYAEFKEQKEKIMDLGQRLKQKTEVENLKNKILSNIQKIIDQVSEYKTTDPNTEIGKSKNAIAVDLAMRLKNIKMIFANNSDVKQCKDTINLAINEIINNLQAAALSKASSTFLTSKRDTSNRFADVLNAVVDETQKLSIIFDTMDRLTKKDAPIIAEEKQASATAFKSTH